MNNYSGPTPSPSSTTIDSSTEAGPVGEDTVVLITGGGDDLWDFEEGSILDNEVFPASHSGCSLPPLPAARQFHAAFLTAELKPKVALCGGREVLIREEYSGTYSETSDSCIVFNPVMQIWDGNEMGNLTSVRGHGRALTLQTVGTYILGGANDDGYIHTFDFLPRGSKQWVVGPTYPDQLSFACAVALDDLSFLLIYDRDIIEYKVDNANPVSNEGWQERTKWPQLQTRRRYGLGCSKIKKMGVISGGTQYESATEVLDLATRTIEYAGATNLPWTFSYVATVKTGGLERVLAFGGGFEPRSSVEEFNPDTKTPVAKASSGKNFNPNLEGLNDSESIKFIK